MVSSVLSRIALEVREQHRDVLALSFEGTLGGQDLLGQVLRSVCIGRGELTRQCARLEPSATLAAELLGGRIVAATLPAKHRETGAAFAAEFHLDGVLVTALTTPHQSPPGAVGIKEQLEPSGQGHGQQGICQLSGLAREACRVQVWVIFPRAGTVFVTVGLPLALDSRRSASPRGMSATSGCEQVQ
jgi:hypothetical protein